MSIGNLERCGIGVNVSRGYKVGGAEIVSTREEGLCQFYII